MLLDRTTSLTKKAETIVGFFCKVYKLAGQWLEYGAMASRSIPSNPSLQLYIFSIVSCYSLFKGNAIERDNLDVPSACKEMKENISSSFIGLCNVEVPWKLVKYEGVRDFVQLIQTAASRRHSIQNQRYVNVFTILNLDL